MSEQATLQSIARSGHRNFPLICRAAARTPAASDSKRASGLRLGYGITLSAPPEHVRDVPMPKSKLAIFVNSMLVSMATRCAFGLILTPALTLKWTGLARHSGYNNRAVR
jgi:hypothetical protein